MTTLTTRDHPRSGRGAWRRIRLAGGWMMLAIGLVMLPLPWPFGFGLPLSLVGLMIVLGHSPTARRRFLQLRARYPRLFGPVRRLLRRFRRTHTAR